MKIYGISNNEAINTEILSEIIKNVSGKANLFSGNCGILAIALAKFLQSIGSYNLQYLVYVNRGEDTIEDYFFNGETDIYHVVLSVVGEGIDDFFDGHGSCDDSNVLSILGEYGENFETVTILKLPVSNGRVETFIRNNTNFDSGSISREAINNPNCPPLAKIKWMREFGLIGTEDPSKHIIEYDGKEEKDEDLEKLKQMVSGNKFNLLRHSRSNQIIRSGISMSELAERANVYELAGSPNTSLETLAEIYNNNPGHSYLSSYIAYNPRCPPEILIKALSGERGEYVAICAADNKGCPPEILADLLSKGKDDLVSLTAIRNPRCPPLAKIKWMRQQGLIGKEDPNKHIIEEVEEQKDEDLEKLKQMVSGNKFNLLRHSQELSLPLYYNPYEIAEDPNTSPEILKETLKNDNKYLAGIAAKNPNCPPEALAEVLKKGENDYISQCAANVPNCPPEALAGVLNRGKNDEVSWYAARNPNCPPLAKINWMRQIGLIGKEDPNKHIIEYDSEEIRDKDLEALEKMVEN